MTLKLSYSAINTYQTCPLQYRLKYVEGRPSLPGAALSFGSSVHDALRWFYDVPTPDAPALDDLLDYLETCWSSEGYASPEEEVRYYYQARSTLELFHRQNADSFRVPAALEKPFRVDLGFCELSGVIDRLDKDPNGGFEIIDYKTNRRLPPERKLREDLQLPIYHIAVERVWGVAPERVTFYFLLHGHRHSVPITPQRLDTAFESIQAVASSVQRGDFEPRRNPLCPWCDFLDECDMMAGKVEARRSANVPALEVGQAVDELLTSERRALQMEGRLEGLRQIVGSYLSDSGVAQVGGSRAVARLCEDGSLRCTDLEGER